MVQISQLHILHHQYKGKLTHNVLCKYDVSVSVNHIRDYWNCQRTQLLTTEATPLLVAVISTKCTYIGQKKNMKSVAEGTKECEYFFLSKGVIQYMGRLCNIVNNIFKLYCI